MQYPRIVRDALQKTAGRLAAADDRKIAARVGLGAGAFYAWSALPGLHWHDTAEFAAVGWRLSLSHPPGHPLHALLTKAAQLLVPVGDLAFRANLLSAIVVAAALALGYRVARRMAPDAPRWLAAAAMLLAGSLPIVWLQAVRAEVYGLQLLLTVACAGLSLAVARGDGRALPALALAFGLAGANHSLIGLFMLPIALWAMAVGLPRTVRAGRSALRPIVAALPMGALGLSGYVYLKLRATAGGVVGWGRPESAGELWGIISARDWSRELAPPVDTSVVDNIAILAGFAIEQVGPIAALLLLGAVLAGVAPLVRARSPMAVAALAALAVPVASRVIYPLDLGNPDLGGYLAGAALAAAALVVVAVGALPDGLRRWLGLAVPAALLLTLTGFDPGARVGSRSAETVAVARLAEVPPDGVFVSSDYATAFQTWALRALYGARPDVAPIFRGRVDTAWQRARLADEHPAVAARLPGFPDGFDGPHVRFEPGVEMQRLGPLEARLRPVGLTLAVDMDWPTNEALTRALWPLDRFSDRDARRQAAFTYAQHASHLVGIGAPPSLSLWMIERAEALAPGDAVLAELRLRAAGPQ